MSGRDSRPVYETGRGRLCPRCGFPAHDGRCSSRVEPPVPAKIACALRLEKKGRAGKSVTVVAGLPRGAAFLAALAAELKKACGTGGAATEDAVFVQGDQRERLRPLLAAKGWTVRG